MSNRSLLEQETMINYNEAEKEAYVFTFNKPLQRKLEKFSAERPDECRKVPTVQPLGLVEYIVPKKWIKVSPPRQLNLSDEQREALAKWFASNRKA